MDDCADGAMCYILEATALPEVEVTYAKRRMWVDAALFIVRREELLSASGRLLKVATVDEVQEIAGRNFPTRITMEDVLRRGSSTTLEFTHVELDVDIPEDLFTLRSLMR